MNSPPPLPPLFDPNKSFQALWRQAFFWLNQCHVLPPEAVQVLSLPNSTIEDLADVLSDGIVLCNLLNYLAPGIIKYTDVSCRPQRSRFLCLQNIRLFLDTCRRELNFRDRDLFDPYMLFDKYDLDKIVETLSRISRLDIAKRKKLIPFPMNNSPVTYMNIQKDDGNSSLPIIRSLDETVPKPEPAKLQRQSSLCHSCRYARIHHVPSFLATDVPQSNKQESSFIKTTSSTNLTESPSSASMIAASAASTLSSAAATTEQNVDESISDASKNRSSTSSLPFSILNGDSGVYGSRISIVDDVYEHLCERPKTIDNHRAFLPRDHCVKELLDTELNYRDSLNQIVKHFIDPLQLKQDDREKLFLNISEIQALHTDFYEDLKTAGRNEKGRTLRIVELFEKWQDRFLIYAKYCSELPDAQVFLDRKIKQDQSFAQKLEQCRQKAGELGKFQLRDTVVLPFQRIVKYSLLLHTMKKNVPSTDANGDVKRQLLDKAENLMIDVTQYINEAKRAHDNMKVISNIEKTICDLKQGSDRCLRHCGRFIADDQFTIYEDGHRGATRTVFLFDRIILICKMKSQDKYAYRSTITIDGCSIEEVKAVKREFSFIIRDHEKHERKFVAKTDEKRSFWLRLLREAIDRCSNPELFDDGHHFQMKTFDEINPRCDSCARYLCGIFFQGYECTRCRKRVHRDCVKKIGNCSCRTSVERMRSFDRGPIELSDNFGSSVCPPNNQSRFYALYDYDGAARTSRISDRHIRVNEGDELEVIEDDDEQIWKVKNLRTNEIGLIPATFIGAHDVESPKVAERTSVNSSEISSMVREFENWYLDTSRHQAEEILRTEGIPNNTFLVRKQGKNEGHAISIKHNNEVYHIRIFTQEVEGIPKYYLVDGLQFESLQALIQYYQNHSLEDRFPPVKSSLVYPIAQVLGHDTLIQPGTL